MIQAAAPAAEEATTCGTSHWQIPMFRLKGMLVCCSARKGHCAMHILSRTGFPLRALRIA